MRSHVTMWSLVLSLIASGQALAGDRGYCEPGPQHLLQRIHPVGGWHPYGGGLLHWWPRHCFPRCGGPDDYCRKPPPRVCWPPYPPYYIGGPSEIHYPHVPGPGESSRSHAE
jgi:hypothetical protein